MYVCGSGYLWVYKLLKSSISLLLSTRWWASYQPPLQYSVYVIPVCLYVYMYMYIHCVLCIVHYALLYCFVHMKQYFDTLHWHGNHE